MLIIISLKKLSSNERLEIRKHYSLIEYNDSNHKFKNISKLGNAELLWFSVLPSIVGNINNNTFKYLLNHINELVKPTVVIVYNQEKYKKLLKGLTKITNFFIKDFPHLKQKNLHSFFSKTKTIKKEEKEEKNLLLESETEEEDTDVDFSEFHEILTTLQNKYNRLKTLYKKEQDKHDKLKSSFELKIVNLKKQINILENQTLLKPVLEREKTSSTENITIEDKSNHLIVTSNLSGLLETQSYTTRRDKNKKLQSLRQKYLKN